MCKTREVLAWLVLNNIKQKWIAIDMGVSQALVNGTIHNHYRYQNKRVIAKLLVLGCPAEYLVVEK